MIYAKYINEVDSTGARLTAMPSYSTPPDATYAAYAVPDASWLYISNGAIAMRTQAEMDATQLGSAQIRQIALLGAAYAAAIQQPVSYMGTTFQADSASQNVLTKCLVSGSVPSGFYWLDANNNAVSMTYAQLQELAGAMLIQGQIAFAHLQTQKSAVLAATTSAAVNSIVW